MKHLPTILCATLAVLFAVLYLTKELPEPEPQEDLTPVLEARDAEIAELRRKLLDQEMRTAELHLALAENNVETDLSRARFADAPDLDAALEEAGPADLDQLEEQLATKIGGALSGLFKGINISNVVESSNVTMTAGNHPMSGAFKDQLKARNQARLERDYADLLTMLELDAEKQRTLLDLLAERDARWMRPGQVAEAEANITAFLGEDGAKLYREFEDTKYARKKLGTLEQILGPELALQPAQRQQMLALYDGMEGFSKDYQRRAHEPDDHPEKRLEELAQRYEQLLKDASAFLDNDQSSALAGHLENQRKQAEAQVAFDRKFNDQLGLDNLDQFDVQVISGDAAELGNLLGAQVAPTTERTSDQGNKPDPKTTDEPPGKK